MGYIGKWFLLLSKRLYKKISFVILLVLIPACIAAFGLVAKQDSGFVRVALAQEPGSGTDGARVIEELLAEKGAILFTYAASPAEAADAVRAGKVDEAWVFPADVFEATQSFYKGSRDYVVRVLTKEDSMAMRLGREKIPASLFEYCAKSYYLEYIRANIPQLATLSDGELLVYFEEAAVTEEFFTYRNPSDQNGISQSGTYLTSPIRGLLAILMLLGSMAATMFYMQDTAAGTFSLVKERFQGLVALGSVMTAAVHIAVVVLLSLCLSSLTGSILLEIVILLAYALCCGAFCMLMKTVFSNLRGYCAVIPMLIVIMIGICPVFVDFRGLSVLQYMLPPTYYVNSIYHHQTILYMLLYSAACLMLAWLLKKLKLLLMRSK